MASKNPGAQPGFLLGESRISQGQVGDDKSMLFRAPTQSHAEFARSSEVAQMRQAERGA